MSDENQTNHLAVIKELTRAVDALCQVSQTNHLEMAENQKNLMREIMSERRDLEKEARKNHKEEMGYQHRLTFISVLVVVLSIFVGGYMTFRQMTISALYKRENVLEARIVSWGKAYDNLMIAMANLRGIRDEGQSLCRNGEYTGANPIAYREKLFSATYRLVGASFVAARVFDTETRLKIISFLSDINPDKSNICAKDSPTDKSLRVKQDTLSNMMLNQIATLEKQKNDLVDQINKDK